jgi:hypothetical protein
MGAAAPFISIGMGVLNAGMGFLQASQEADNQAKMAGIQAKQAAQQTLAQYQEVDRQQREVNRVAEEQRSDRMRKARQELGTMRVLIGERGVSSTTGKALMSEVGYFAGLDLSRIEGNRQANIEAGEASKRAAQQGGLNSIEIAQNQIKVANKGVNMALLGTGLQILGSGVSAYSDYSWKQDQLQAIKDLNEQKVK